MFIRAYLIASTKKQDAKRAKNELMQLIDDAHEGDVILVEQIDRLARLNQADWDALKRMLSEKKLAVVSKELPTSYMALQSERSTEFMSSVLQAINSMMLDMLAAIARKDYKDRRNRQMQGIARAKTEGKYLGRRQDTEKRKIINSLLKSGHSYSQILKLSKKHIACCQVGIYQITNGRMLSLR